MKQGLKFFSFVVYGVLTIALLGIIVYQIQDIKRERGGGGCSSPCWSDTEGKNLKKKYNALLKVHRKRYNGWKKAQEKDD